MRAQEALEVLVAQNPVLRVVVVVARDVEVDVVQLRIEELAEAGDVGVGVKRLSQHVRAGPRVSQDDEPDVIGGRGRQDALVRICRSICQGTL